MRTSLIPRAAARMLGAAALAASTACSGFLEVDNPNVIDAGSLNPVQDATTLANSAQQSYQSALGFLIMYGAWFTGEADVAETFPTRNEYGFRNVAAANGSHNADVWFPLSQAAAGNALVLNLDLPTPDTNINYVRTHTWRAYSFVLMAEQFCVGTVSGGPPLTTNDMLDSAIANFTTAITKGTANATAAAVTLANISRVGRARAHLQRGNLALAIADAQAVPAAFNFNFTHVDDAGNRTRLSNRMWQFTFDRGSISVAPAYRVVDTRIAYLAPGSHSLTAQDANNGPFYIQQKYPAYASPLRVASKLEADYIEAEATAGTAAKLALIALRRTAGGLAPYAGPTDAASVLTELMTQKHRDFWLEGQRFGDWRRNPTSVLNTPTPGAAYFKPGFPTIGNQTCYPLPLAETDNNPNIP
jgi:starch-binding outer membrane protein, SusD/RagB family